MPPSVKVIFTNVNIHLGGAYLLVQCRNSYVLFFSRPYSLYRTFFFAPGSPLHNQCQICNQFVALVIRIVMQGEAAVLEKDPRIKKAYLGE